MLITKCKACYAKIVFFTTDAGKSIPINWESLTLGERLRVIHKEPVELDLTHMITHFATCPKAGQFRRTTKQ